MKTINLKLYYAYTFFGSMAFSRAIFMLYLVYLGFTNTQMGLLESVLFIGSFAMEIPTGMLGDKIGRKWSIACGVAIDIFASLAYLVFHHFNAFIFLFILHGTSFAFISGSNRALLYDSLIVSKREQEYVKIESRMKALAIATLGLSMIAGGYLKLINWNAVYIASAIAAFITLMIVVNFTEVNVSQGHEESAAERLMHVDSMRQAFRDFMTHAGNRPLIWLALGIAVFSAFATPFSIYNQLLLNHYKMDADTVGLIKGLGCFSAAAVVLLAEPLAKRLGMYRVVYTIFAACFALLLLELLGLPVLAVVIYLVIDSIAEIAYTLLDNETQTNVPSRIRASLLSAFAFSESVLIALTYYVWGILLDHMPAPVAISLLAVFLVISAICIALYRKKRTINAVI